MATKQQQQQGKTSLTPEQQQGDTTYVRETDGKVVRRRMVQRCMSTDNGFTEISSSRRTTPNTTSTTSTNVKLVTGLSNDKQQPPDTDNIIVRPDGTRVRRVLRRRASIGAVPPSPGRTTTSTATPTTPTSARKDVYRRSVVGKLGKTSLSPEQHQAIAAAAAAGDATYVRREADGKVVRRRRALQRRMSTGTQGKTLLSPEQQHQASTAAAAAAAGDVTTYVGREADGKVVRRRAALQRRMSTGNGLTESRGATSDGVWVILMMIIIKTRRKVINNKNRIQQNHQQQQRLGWHGDSK